MNSQSQLEMTNEGYAEKAAQITVLKTLTINCRLTELTETISKLTTF